MSKNFIQDVEQLPLQLKKYLSDVLKYAIPYSCNAVTGQVLEQSKLEEIYADLMKHFTDSDESLPPTRIPAAANNLYTSPQGSKNVSTRTRSSSQAVETPPIATASKRSGGRKADGMPIADFLAKSESERKTICSHWRSTSGTVCGKSALDEKKNEPRCSDCMDKTFTKIPTKYFNSQETKQTRQTSVVSTMNTTDKVLPMVQSARFRNDSAFYGGFSRAKEEPEEKAGAGSGGYKKSSEPEKRQFGEYVVPVRVENGITFFFMDLSDKGLYFPVDSSKIPITVCFEDKDDELVPVCAIPSLDGMITEEAIKHLAEGSIEGSKFTDEDKELIEKHGFRM